MNALFSASSARNLLLGWIVPSLIAVSVTVFFLFPVWGDEFAFAKKLEGMSWGERSAVLAGAAFSIGFLLNSWQSGLYRLLEGYLLPVRLQRWLIARKRQRKAEIKLRYDEARDAANDQRRMNIELERYRKFPPDDEIMPTSLGNAIRSAEAYSWDRYRLDIVTLWYHLQAVIPEPLRADEDRARSAIDFQICAFYLSAVVAGLSALTMGVAGPSTQLVVLAGVPIFVATLFYRGAVVAAHEWRKSMEAIADVGRAPLAVRLDLSLPASLESEREMWRVVGQIVKYPYTKKRSLDLGPFRR
jgi:hypothetical protein